MDDILPWFVQICLLSLHEQNLKSEWSRLKVRLGVPGSLGFVRVGDFSGALLASHWAGLLP